MASPRRGVSLQLDRGLARLRSQMWLILQAAVAASVSWELASLAFPHSSPLFAPFAAIVCLASGYAQRTRRTLELILGVALGIGVADLAARAIGTGWWQLFLITLAAMSAAVLLDAGRVFVLQAGLSAMIVVTVQPPGSGLAGQRFLEVLIGGSVALAVSSLAPADPRRALSAAAASVLDEFTETLRDIAVALDALDLPRARGALERARGIDSQTANWQDAVRIAQETMWTSPTVRRMHREIEAQAQAAAYMDLAVRNLRVLSRAVIRGIELGEAVPAGIGVALHRLAGATADLAAELGGDDQHADSRRPVLLAVAAAATALRENGSLSVAAIVGQIRSTATDLLSALGDREEDARWAVRIAAGETVATSVASLRQ
ncbi:MAG: FUSC family protein [Solirubrobacteraceae bacterium]